MQNYAHATAGKALPLLPTTVITAAVSGSVGVAFANLVGAKSLTIQAKFTYGAGGTNAKFWIQTSFDGGTTWVDIANHAFLLVSKTTVNSLRIDTAVAAAYVPTDGTLADDTIKDGLLGDRFRVKYTTTGTYTTNTTIKIDAIVRA